MIKGDPKVEMDLTEPLYRCQHSDDLSEEIRINTDRSIEIIFRSPLDGQPKHKTITGPTDSKLRYFISKFQHSNEINFNTVKDLLIIQS